jgi:DNA polymerase III subunit gamma/tau
VTSLANKYRPATISDTVGQPHVKAVLKAMIRKNSLPAALIFAGTRGTGKTTTGRTIAAAANCPDGRPGDCCGTCPSCRSIQEGSALSTLEIDAASNGTVAEIRKIKDLVQYAAGDIVHRFILLDEAHSMSKEAFNALLKVLEEPPPDTTFILLTTEPNKILQTVTSRCMTFEFRRLSVADIVGRLKHITANEGIPADTALLEEIANRAEGGMRDAIMTLDQASRVGVTDVASLHELLGIVDVSTDILEAAASRDLNLGLTTLDSHFYRCGDAAGLVSDLTRLTTDIIRITAGGATTITQPATAARARALADRLDISHLTATMKILWDLRNRVRHVDNDQRTAMEAAFVLICDAIHPTRVTAAAKAASTAEANRKLSLDEMRRMASSAA